MVLSQKTKSEDRAVKDERLYQAFGMMRRKEYDEALDCLKEGVANAKQNNDTQLEGLYYSAMGVLFKLKKNYNKSFRFYQQAEKLLKHDPSIKIVTAMLLIEQFKQYSTAARKMTKVLAATQDPAVWHRAKAIETMALFLMGKKEQAELGIKEMLKQDFKQLRFAANLDYKMVELFINKNFMNDECREYLKKALALAKSKNEKTFVLVIENLLKAIG